jgi:zinc D-Ala-D-Ala carboxypeptidase
MGDLSTNFSREEFACQCGCGRGLGDGEVSPDLVLHLENIRSAMGRPLFITSGCRCDAHNAAEGGVDGSVHTMLPLVVADVRAYPGPHKYNLVSLAFNQGATGVGVANSFIHMDWHDGSVKARPAVWHY